MREVAVIGAGVAGIQAALDIANHQVHVHLIEREPSIGGHMAQLDKTFPTNDCSMCILSPKMVEVARHPWITLHTCTEVTSIEGAVGDFSVTLQTSPRYVDPDLCNGCGDCEQICPVEVYNRFDAGIGVRKAIYKQHAQVVPNIMIKDDEHCIECGLCYDVCGRNAVLREQSAVETTVHVASVVITTGYQVFDPTKKAQYGYGLVPDVITSLELERMINAGGPTRGEVRRISNGQTPRSIVFIQCVGSRDLQVNRPYCSCVCCMAAIKNAMLIREKHPEIEVAICYMDIRAYGKGYQEFYQRAQDLGVRFVRGMPGAVIDSTGPMELQVEDTLSGELLQIHPDLVVLSVGIEPASDPAVVAARFGLTCEESGFLEGANAAMNTVGTVRPGIYIAGTATAPKDIPDCVTQGQAAAMRAYTDAIRVN
ncbi:FAD-dependent oxidoreductase [Methanosphaerula subterraneus]|uniref:FAD-dependent oxidoreductase n=1 Tax=Methanosphaerula subterraneus TaxID=3350244 RepID=UPI003F86B26F